MVVKALTAFVAALLACPMILSCATWSAAPTIRFGLMNEEASGRYAVYKQTTEIPLVLAKADPEFRFGFDVEHTEVGNFVGHIVLRYPDNTRTVKATFGNEDVPNVEDQDAVRRSITTEKREYKRFWWMDIQLTDEDDVGDYQLDIFIDDALVRTINYRVFAPARSFAPP